MTLRAGVEAILSENERLRAQVAELRKRCDAAEAHGFKVIDLYAVREVIG